MSKRCAPRLFAISRRVPSGLNSRLHVRPPLGLSSLKISPDSASMIRVRSYMTPGRASATRRPSGETATTRLHVAVIELGMGKNISPRSLGATMGSSGEASSGRNGRIYNANRAPAPIPCATRFGSSNLPTSSWLRKFHISKSFPATRICPGLPNRAISTVVLSVDKRA